MQAIQTSIISFVKKYWWIWLLLYAASVVVTLKGESIAGTALYKIFLFVLQATFFFGILIMIWDYFIGKKSLNVWWVFRFLGLIGILAASDILFGVWKEFKMTEVGFINLTSGARTFFVSMVFMVFLFCFFIAVGEMLLYLYRANKKLDNLNQRAREMTCPKCNGKGFVDISDIKRFEMVDSWKPGVCDYCDAEGYVERGKTKKEDPRDLTSLKHPFGSEEEADAILREFDSKKRQQS